jgi:hypothetical protein
MRDPDPERLWGEKTLREAGRGSLGETRDALELREVTPGNGTGANCSLSGVTGLEVVGRFEVRTFGGGTAMRPSGTW